MKLNFDNKFDKKQKRVIKRKNFLLIKIINFYLELLDACFDGDVIKAEECLAHLGAHAKAVLNSSPNGSDTLNFLYRACRTGNVDLVKLLLKHGAIAKPHRQTSYSPLYIACRIGNFEIVEMLLTV